MKLPENITPEQAVRFYLLFIENPDQLKDQDEIQRATQAVLAANDPIDKLKALSHLEEVAQVHEDPLIKLFIEHAKSWAESNGIPVQAFQELGVPDAVLHEAEFELPRPKKAAARRGRTPDNQRQRAKAVPIEDIKAAALTLSGVFVLTDIEQVAGGSPATIRKAVDTLVLDGLVEKLGPVPNYGGRGRAPIQYQVVKKAKATKPKPETKEDDQAA